MNIVYGYIKTHTPELRMREWEYYQSVYCGLCRTMGKCTGQCSRLTLSYDFTFFALVRMALEGKNPTAVMRRCVVHPLRKRPMIPRDDTLELCAYLSALLVYHKLADDRRDERGGKRFASCMARPYAASLRKKALKEGYGQADEHIKACLLALADLEAQKPMSADRPAELFGDLMAYLLAYGLEGNTAILAKHIGRHVGRWIYFMDAIDDFDEDKKKGRYNPFLCLWSGSEMTEERKKTLEQALKAELEGVENALNLCDTQTRESQTLWGVVKNVLYLGMPVEAKKILYPDEAHDKKTKRKRRQKKKAIST